MTLRNANWRDTQDIARLQSIGNVDTLAINPDLPASDDAVDMALGHPLANPQQIVVEALTLLIIRNNGLSAPENIQVLPMGAVEAIARMQQDGWTYIRS